MTVAGKVVSFPAKLRYQVVSALKKLQNYRWRAGESD